MKIHPNDWKRVPKNADADFSAERNRRIINEVIEETEKIQARKRKESSDALEERADAAATYLYNISQGGRTSDVMKYFGRKELMRLKGQEVMQKIHQGLTIVKDGKVVKKAGE